MEDKLSEPGAVNPLLIASIIVGLMAAVFAGFGIWAFVNYQDQKNNVDLKIEAAVSAAKAEQKSLDEADYTVRANKTTREFVGPQDLGSVKFQYPRDWSVYMANSGSNGKLEAYLHPDTVPTVASSQPYALRVTVESSDYSSVVKSYERKVTTKELVSNPITIGSFSGIRLDGTFSASRKGSAVVFKVRDKTLTIASDAESFKTVYDTVVLPSLTFNP